MQYGDGMEDLKYPTRKLLEKVKENRKKHAEDYRVAIVEYRKQMVDYLRNLLAQAIENNNIDHTIKLEKPVQYLQHYDRAIAQLEFTNQEEVGLSQVVFAQLYLDEWSWKLDFSNKTLGYSNSRR